MAEHFCLDFELSDQHTAQIDILRGDVPREDFLLQCVQMGLIDFQDEANRVHRDFLHNWATHATDYFKQFKETRKFSLSKRRHEVGQTVHDQLQLARKP
jgi:hypothetical protein